MSDTLLETITFPFKGKSTKEELGRYEYNRWVLTNKYEKTIQACDKLGKLEIEILKGFDIYSDLFSFFTNRPEISEITIEKIKIPALSIIELKNIADTAKKLLKGLNISKSGIASGIAAVGGVTAVNTASIIPINNAFNNDTDIVNTTMATLENKKLTSNGTDIIYGSIVLPIVACTLGALFGFVVYKFWSNAVAKQKFFEDLPKYQNKMKESYRSLDIIESCSNEYYSVLESVNNKYQEELCKLGYVVLKLQKNDWNNFSVDERKCAENCTLLTGLLHTMCKLELTQKNPDHPETNKANVNGVKDNIALAEDILKNL